MSAVWLAGLSAAYLLMLFAIARYADQRGDAGRSLITPNVYALSLAVYCTSWTFFGSVGRATSGGLGFLTIYIGPTLVMLLPGFLRKLVRISKAYRITSIADFIASRYGKSQGLAGLVTVIAVVGVVPYIALQLKAVSAALLVLFPAEAGGGEGWFDSTFLVALAMAAFTIVFGTRHLDATERHEGMVAAIAFEAVVKLCAFLAVGVFVTYGLFDGFADLFSRAAAMPSLSRLLGLDAIRPASWHALILLSGLAIVFLPRQFQILVVENVDETHLQRASWLFPLYLLLINLFVLPLALGGMLYFGETGVNPETFVLSLPLAEGLNGLTLFAFIGGLSAATGMVIVETIALSTMVCNDLVMPLLLRSGWLAARHDQALPGILLRIRRLAIMLVLLLGYAYFRLAGEAHALVGIGLISFCAVAQFAPAMLGAMYWKSGTRAGAMAGLLGGFAIWLYTLLLPAFARSGWIEGEFVTLGPFGLEWLRAGALFGLAGLDEISHCLWWSLLINTGLYAGVSLLGSPDALEAAQAERFVDIDRHAGRDLPASAWRGATSLTALHELLGRFLGMGHAQQFFHAQAAARSVEDWRKLPADAQLIHRVESELSAVIGAASARVMVASVIEEETLGLQEVLDILDEASEVRAYSKALEVKSLALEAATAELREANERLVEVDRMKDDFISTVTHELRTPLTSIRALSEMLNDDPEMDLAHRQRFLGIIVGETERLTRLINQVLDLAKLESGQAEWTTARIDLADVIRECVETVAPLFAEKGVGLSCDLPPARSEVLADRDRLVQVLINLLSNAVKFVPGDSGTVRISLRQVGECWRVSVADNGPGLTEDECSRVFEKFRQGGNTLTAKPQGTGLGLPISRQIIEYFGGNLWVESAPGAGADFIFTLPLAAGPQDETAPT